MEKKTKYKIGDTFIRDIDDIMVISNFTIVKLLDHGLFYYKIVEKDGSIKHRGISRISTIEFDKAWKKLHIR